MAEPITIDIFLKAKNQTREGIKEATQGLKEVAKGAKGASRAVEKVGNSSKGIVGALGDVEKASRKVKDGLDGVKESGSKAKTGLDGVESSTKKTKRGLDDVEKSSRQTRRTLKELAREKAMILLEAKDRLTPVLERAGVGLRGLTRKAWGITMKVTDLATAPIRGIFKLLRSPVVQIGATLGVSLGIKDTVDTYAGFESAMSQVRAISGADNGEFAELTEKAKEMGASTKYTATESAEAFNYMAMAGWGAEDMLGGIEGIMSLAAASGEELGTTSDIVTDALTAFGLKAGESGHFADVLAQASAKANTNVGLMGESFKYVAPVAGALGYEIEDVSLALGLMANSSVKGSMAGTSLKASLSNMAAPTKEMASAMKQYQISLKNSKGETKSLKEVMDNLRGSLGGLSETEQTAAASTIFGKDAMAGMLAIINASEEDYDKLTEAVYHAEGAAGQMADTMMDNLSGSLTSLQSTIDGVKLAFGERLKPYIQGLAVWLKDMMPDIEKGLDHFMDYVDEKIGQLKDKIADFTGTKEWENADFFGKIEIAWDELIADPFAEWWESTGRQKIADAAANMGDLIGTGLNRGIMALLGVGDDGVMEEGLSAGATFVDGFLKGFEPEKIKKAVLDAMKGIFSDSCFGGGDGVLSTLLVGAVGLKGLGAGAQVGKGIADTYSTIKILGGLFKPAAVPGIPGTPAMPGAPGVPALPGPVAGPVVAGGSFSIPVLASVAGGILGVMGLSASMKDLKKAQNAGLTWEKDKYTRQGLTKGGLVAGGAAAGAAIGSVVPGAGTLVGGLIGGGLGGIAALTGGNFLSELFKSERERAHESLMQMGDDLEEALANFEETTSKTEVARGLIEEYQELRDYMNSPEFDHTKAEEVQERMKGILDDLQRMFPDLYTGYDTLNGLSQERIDWIEKEMDKEDEKARRQLMQTVVDTHEKIPLMKEDYQEVTADIEEKQAEWNNIMEYRRGLGEIKIRYEEALENEAPLDEKNEILRQAEVLAEQHGFGRTGSFTNNYVGLGVEITDMGSKSQKLSDAINARTQEQAEMDAQIQTYYDSSIKLIEMDTGVDLEGQQKKMDTLREAYKFVESNQGIMSDEMRQGIEEILPGFSELGDSKGKLDAIIGGLKDLYDEAQPAYQKIQDLDKTLEDLPDEKRIKITLYGNTSILTLPEPGIGLVGLSNGMGFTKPEKVGKKATGGLVNGAELSWIGEDGPEAIIPLSGKYRRRGLELYEQAGRFLGVGYNAEGGVYNTAAYAAPAAVSGSTAISNMEQSTVIQVTASPQTQVKIDLSSSQDEIMDALRQSWAGVTDQMLAEIAQKILLSFENIPGGAV